MHSQFLIPSFSNLEIKYFEKVYYTNREIIGLQSNYVLNNPSLSTIILPSIKGPIDELINYLYGQESIKIDENNAFFYELMSTFLEFRDKQIYNSTRNFLPNHPTLNMVDLFFKSTKETNFSDNNVYTPYIDRIKDYFKYNDDAYISYYAVNLALNKSINLDLPSAEKILKCLLKDFQTTEYQDEKYNEIEKTIVAFIEKYPAAQLLRTILLTPFFNIGKITMFKDLVSQFTEETYPNESNEGYFESHKGDDDNKDNFSIQINSDSIEEPFDFKIVEKVNPTFIISFHTFSFDIQSYSLKIDSSFPFPINWSVYASSDRVNYEEIHHVENCGLFLDNDEMINFKVTNHVRFARSLKFVLFRSSKEHDDDNDNDSLIANDNLNTLAISKFDIYGTFHNSFSYENKNCKLLNDRRSRAIELLLDLARRTEHRSSDTDGDELSGISFLQMLRALDLSTDDSETNTD